MNRFNCERATAPSSNGNDRSQQNSTDNNTPVRCNRDNPCPICEGTETQCYQFLQEVWCVSIHSPPPGWRKIGLTQSKQSRFKPVQVKLKDKKMHLLLLN